MFAMPTIKALDSTLFYEERGVGKPIVFLHGNPTSSYLWRKILPQMGARHCLAPDLIGMGQSGKPNSEYHFADHARYLEAWFDALELEEVVLVGHDWGGALAFDWVARHPERVRGLVFMETIVRPLTWNDFPGAARGRIETLRAPQTGETKVLDENFFIEQALRSTVLKGLSDEDWAVYRKPYPTLESRRPLLAWPRAFPIEGEPADVTERVEHYDEWLKRSEEIPKLLLTFEGALETLLIGAEMTAWCAANIANLEIENCGSARHLAPEDQPEAITVAVTKWLHRHQL
jgi:haloalkane dehalogenase